MVVPSTGFLSPEFWSRRPVLVTGCTGILGSELTQQLVDLGANVTGLVRDRVPHSNLWRSPAGDSISVVTGDLHSVSLLQRILAEYEIDTIFHLAAQTIVPIANRSPLSTFESNVRGTWNLLEAARTTSGVGKVVVASSDKAYGDSDRLPYTESHRLEGKTPYDVSKSCSDLIAQSYHAHFGLAVCISRCGNIFGPGDLNWNRLIPGTIRSNYFKEKVYVRSDGSSLRDYVYVKDVAASYLAIAHAMENPAVHGEAFNVSDESPLSVLDVVRTLCELMQVPFEPEIANVASGEIPAQHLDCSKLRAATDWRPMRTLEQALRETIDWYHEFFASTSPARANKPASA